MKKASELHSEWMRDQKYRAEYMKTKMFRVGEAVFFGPDSASRIEGQLNVGDRVQTEFGVHGLITGLVYSIEGEKAVVQVEMKNPRPGQTKQLHTFLDRLTPVVSS